MEERIVPRKVRGMEEEINPDEVEITEEKINPDEVEIYGGGFFGPKRSDWKRMRAMFSGEDPYAAATSPENRQQLEASVNLMPDPDAERRKIAVTAYMSRMKRENVSFVYDNLDQILKEYYGKKTSVDEAFKDIGGMLLKGRGEDGSGAGNEIYLAAGSGLAGAADFALSIGKFLARYAVPHDVTKENPFENLLKRAKEPVSDYRATLSEGAKTKTIAEAWKAGETDANLIKLVAEEGPALALQIGTVLLTGGAGPFLMGGVFTEEKREQLLKENPEMSLGQMGANLAMTYIINTFDSIVDMKVLKGASAPVRKEMTESIFYALKHIFKPVLIEGGTEGLQRLAENGADYITGVYDKEIASGANVSDLLVRGVPEEALLGAISGAGMSALGFRTVRDVDRMNNVLLSTVDTEIEKLRDKETPSDEDISTLHELEELRDAGNAEGMRSVLAQRAIREYNRSRQNAEEAKEAEDAEDAEDAEEAGMTDDDEAKRYQESYRLRKQELAHNPQDTEDAVIEESRLYPSFGFATYEGAENMPAAARKEALRLGYSPRGVDALILGDTCYINTARLRPSDVPKRVLEEVAGHRGLRAVFGEQYDSMLDGVYRDFFREEEFQKIAKRYFRADQLDMVENQRYATEEFLAHNARMKPELKPVWWKEFLQKIKMALRKLPGFQNLRFTDRELEHILMRGIAAVRDNRAYQTNRTDGDVRFAAYRRPGAPNFAEKRGQLRDGNVPCRDGFLQDHGFNGNRIYADYEFLRGKHPEYFPDVEYARAVVEFVLNDPIPAGEVNGNPAFIRRDTETGTAWRIELRVRNNKQVHVRSAHQLSGAQYEKMTGRSDTPESVRPDRSTASGNRPKVDITGHTRAENSVSDFLRYDSTENENVKFSVSPVWTGSAADYDAPSLHYVGTGEGAQVYGWGLYGSSSEKVARWYAGEDVKRKNRDRILLDGKELDNEDVTGRRNLYRQTFWPGKEENLLDWDKPVPEDQRRKIEEQLKAEGLYVDGDPDKASAEYRELKKRKNGGEDIPEKALDEAYEKAERLHAQRNVTGPTVNGDIPSGSMVYENLEDIVGEPKAVSEFLSRAGIDGVTYIGDSSGVRNYVAFSDKDIRVDEHIRFSIQEESDMAEYSLETAAASKAGYRVERVNENAGREFNAAKGVICVPGEELNGSLSWSKEQWREFMTEKNITGMHHVPALNAEAEVRNNLPKRLKGHTAFEEKMNLISVIPEMLNDAVLIQQERKANIISYILAAKVRYGEGEKAKRFISGIVIHQDSSGRLYYDHELTEIEKADGAAYRGHNPTGIPSASVSTIIQNALFASGFEKKDGRNIRFSLNQYSDADWEDMVGYMKAKVGALLTKPDADYRRILEEAGMECFSDADAHAIAAEAMEANRLAYRILYKQVFGKAAPRNPGKKDFEDLNAALRQKKGDMATFAAGLKEGRRILSEEYLKKLSDFKAKVCNDLENIRDLQYEAKKFAYEHVEAGFRERFISGIIRLSKFKAKPSKTYPEGRRRYEFDRLCEEMKEYQRGLLKDKALRGIQELLKRNRSKRTDKNVAFSPMGDRQSALDRISQIVRMNPETAAGCMEFALERKARAEEMKDRLGDAEEESSPERDAAVLESAQAEREIFYLNHFGGLKLKEPEFVMKSHELLKKFVNEGRFEYQAEIERRKSELDKKRVEAIREMAAGNEEVPSGRDLDRSVNPVENYLYQNESITRLFDVLSRTPDWVSLDKGHAGRMIRLIEDSTHREEARLDRMQKWFDTTLKEVCGVAGLVSKGRFLNGAMREETVTLDGKPVKLVQYGTLLGDKDNKVAHWDMGRPRRRAWMHVEHCRKMLEDLNSGMDIRGYLKIDDLETSKEVRSILRELKIPTGRLYSVCRTGKGFRIYTEGKDGLTSGTDLEIRKAPAYLRLLAEDEEKLLPVSKLMRYGAEQQLLEYDAGAEERIHKGLGDDVDESAWKAFQEGEGRERRIELMSPGENVVKKEEALKLSPGAAMELILLWEQDHYRPGMEWNGYTEEVIDQLKRWLNGKNPGYLKFAYAMRKFLSEERAELDEAVFKRYGVHLPETKNFFYGDFSGSVGNRISDPGFGNPSGGMTVNATFLTARRFHLVAPDTHSNAISLFMRKQLEQNHFICWTETLRELRGIYGNRSVQNVMVKEFGQAMWNNLREKIENLASNGSAPDKAAKYLAHFYKSWAPGNVALNASSILKQIVGGSSYGLYVPTQKILRYLPEANHLNRDYRAWLKDPRVVRFLENRMSGGLDPNFAGLLNYTRRGGSVSTLNDAGLKKLLSPQLYTDRLAVTTFGYAAYRHFYEQGRKRGMTLGEAEEYAIRMWQRATDETQQSGALKDQNHFTSNPGVWRYLTTFMTNPMQTASLELTAWQKFLKDRNRKNFGNLANRIIMNHLVNTTLMNLVSSALRHGLNIGDYLEDWDDYAAGWLLGSFDALWLFGKGAMMLIGGLAGDRYASDMSAVPLLSDLARDGRTMVKIANGEEVDILDWMKISGDALMSAGPGSTRLAGILLYALARQGKRWKRLIEGE